MSITYRFTMSTELDGLVHRAGSHRSGASERTQPSLATPTAVSGDAHVRWTLWLDVAVVAAVLVVATARLPIPLGGDQSLNFLFGQVIADGGTPYRDLWDLKHPGVFVFFAAGGALFGFHEVGIHLLELLWMVALALVIRVAAGRWLETRSAAVFAPLFGVGLYYAEAGERYLTQTEPLLQFPLFVCLWCAVAAVRDEAREARWLVVFGMATGVVMTFKLAYVAIPAVFLVLAIREQSRERRGHPVRTAVSAARWVVAGAAIPLLMLIAYLASKGVAGLALWTFFRHPSEAWATVVMEPRRLWWAGRWFAGSFAPVLLLAGIGVADAVQRRQRDLMTAGLCAWILLGAFLIVAQVISWWDYHFLVLAAPLGLLAARGLEGIDRGLRLRLPHERLRLARTAVAGALVLLFAPQLARAGRGVSDMWGTRPLPLSQAGIAAFQAVHYPAYAVIRSRTAFLRLPTSHPGPIYVIDTPAYYVLARRSPAISLLAPWFHPTDRLWNQLLTDLNRTAPAYIRVSDAALQTIVGYRPSLRPSVDGLVPLIERRYRIASTDEDGRWYVLRSLYTGQ